MTQLLYPVFYRQMGVRRVQSLLSPKVMTVTSLPRDSMVHYASLDREHPDVDASKLYYASAKKISIDFPETLTSNLGSPVYKEIFLRSQYKPFLTANKKFRLVRNAHANVIDFQTLIVLNYSYADSKYRYVGMPINQYYHWFNVYKTIFDNIEKIVKEHGRNHFVFIDVPKELPSYNQLEMYKKRDTPDMSKIMDSDGKRFVINLFRWLGIETKKDKLGKLVKDRGDLGPTIFDNLSDSTLSRVNLVLNTPDGRSSILNLSYVQSWIKGNPNTTEITSLVQIDNVQMQKAMLRHLMSLQAMVIEEAPDAVPTEVTLDPLDSQELNDLEEEHREYLEQHEMSENDDIDSHEYVSNAVKGTRGDTPGKNDVVDLNNSKIDEAFVTEIDIEESLKSIDEDLKILETVTARKMLEKGISVDKTGIVEHQDVVREEVPLAELQKKIFHLDDVETVLNQHLETQADYGLIDTTSYRNFTKDIEAFKKSADPYGSGETTMKAMEITPEMLTLDKTKSTIEASSMVQDKSMLESTLLSFDSDYISKIHKKDMLSMVFGLQRAGIVIRNHDVVMEHSALGGYEYHTLEMKPVDGQLSTIRFKVPIVNDDATITASGNKYSMRKQRVDVPIRKIKPTEVALTSYYGKTFVKLNPKKSNSSLEWLIKELNIAALGEGGFIQRVNPAKVFDNNFKAPFIYNAMAANFKSIITDSFMLQFDHTERASLYPTGNLENIEVRNRRLVGVTKSKLPIVVDTNNQFFIVDLQKGQETPCGTINDMLQLDTTKMPVDFCEVNIFSKSVPVALILGYTIGFKNLLRLLQVKYRTTDGRQNKNLQKNEYAISFKDHSYIFDRKDVVASSILAGFNEYDKQLKQFEVDDFSHKDIYLNLLESKGLSSIYIREIELLQQLFVDPITRDILVQMKEPVTFNGLLIRSAELLQTYHHPDSQDMSAMRIRGYERISGAVYKEMVTSIRSYRNRNIAGKSKIEMSPYKIWSTIIQDPAMKLVEDINPIQNLKETEIVTYAGEGGRGKDSMNKASRAYHVNDMGIVSEATVDSSDVGVNAYLSANPQFASLRGLPVLDSKEIKPSSLISTSALLAPGSDSDDPKRVNNLI